MPSASYSPRRPITAMEQAAAVLRANRLRFSASRRAVLDGLLRAEGPVSAEFLASGQGCDLPSAYRNLELFERLGMVRHVHIGHGPGLYALVSEDDPTYLVCEACGRLDRLPADEAARIRGQISSATGFQAHFTHFPILGLCARCTAEGDQEEELGSSEARKHREHAREHSHGDHVHSHPVVQREGTEDDHAHGHEVG